MYHRCPRLKPSAISCESGRKRSVQPARAIAVHWSWRSSMSPNLECGIDRLTQCCLAKGLEQTLHRALFEKGLTDAFIGGGRNENDGQCSCAALQFPLQIGSRHSRHFDIQEQATTLGD